MENFKVIIVEDVPLELKGTEGIFRNEIPEAEIIGTAESETAYWKLIKQQLPDLVLLDLGLGGSTTVGVEICRQTKQGYPNVKVLIFTGEILNEKLWVDVLDAGADGICLKSGELLTRGDVASVMSGKRMVFNQPILEKIVGRFKQSVSSMLMHQEAMVSYEIDEYDERFLRQLALGRYQPRVLHAADREALAAQHTLRTQQPVGGLERPVAQGLGLPGPGPDELAVVLAQEAQRAIAERGHPFAPGARLALELQPPDQGEVLGLAVAQHLARGADAQGAVVLEDLGHGATALQHIALAHHGAAAELADGIAGLGAGKFHGRAAAGAWCAVYALRWTGCHVRGSSVKRGPGA